jgi:hypothetical protein
MHTVYLNHTKPPKIFQDHVVEQLEHNHSTITSNEALEKVEESLILYN